jgi:hypothetical protein
MIRPLCILFLFLAVGRSQAQQVQRKIIDRQTSLSIPYATIKVLHTSKGTIAHEDGSFELDIEPFDSVLITSVGYERLLVTGNQLGSSISMAPVARVMNNVTVRTSIFIRMVVLGNGADLLKKKIKCKWDGAQPYPDCVPFAGFNRDEFAEKISLPDKRHQFLVKKIYLPVRNGCLGPVFLHIYAQDTASEFPGEEIFSKPIFPEKKDISRGKLVVDLSAEDLKFEGGSVFFISFGWLPVRADDDCSSVIFLKRSEQANTYTRTMAWSSFNWVRSWDLRNMNYEQQKTNTLYAVEMEERK